MPSPFDPEGWFGGSSTNGSVVNVAEINPSGQSFVGLAEQLTANQFDPCRTIGINNISVNAGDYVFASILIKQVFAIDDLILNFLVQDEFGTYPATRVSAVTGAVVSTENSEVYSQFLSDGYLLIQLKTLITRDAAQLGNRVIFWDEDTFGPPEIGTKAYVQAAFFGKSDDWPANVMPTL